LLTSDSLFKGKIKVLQEKKGYRFSLDAVILAGLARIKPMDRVVDLGTGCGVIPLILAHRNLGRRIVALEIQQDLATIAKENVEANGFSNRIQVLHGDMREIGAYFPAEKWDVVVCNPPYRRPTSGRTNPNPQRAIARHEFTASLEDVFAAAKYLLVKGGRVNIIYPAARLGYMMVAANHFNFSPKLLTVIYSDKSGPARLVHAEFRKEGGEEIHIAQPFFIYGDDGTYTDAMQEFYGE
jgi:tRNA1Val (adenine37-N6)-methyltransferase